MSPMRLLPVLLVAAIAASACGYALAGRSSRLPEHIRRIGVPMFQNESSTPDLDRVVTEAVQRELRTRGQYIVVSESTGVDAVLTGTIRPLDVKVAAFTDQRLASAYSITLRASVEFKDVKDSKVSCCPGGVGVTEQFDLRGSSAINDPSALFTQDANARERMAREFAKILVSQILESY